MRDRDRWVIDLRWREKGHRGYRRHRETFPIGTKAPAAKARALAVLNAAVAGRYDEEIAPAADTTPAYRLHSALDAWEAHMRSERPKAAASRASLVRVLKACEPFDANPELRALVPFDLERYKAARAKAGASAATVNRGFSALLACLRWAASNGWADDGHVVRLARVKKRQEPPGRVRELTTAEEKRLWSAIGDSPIRPIVAVALMTGLRRGNVVRLRRDEIDLRRREIALATTKANKRHVVPLSDACVDVLRDAMRAHDPKACELDRCDACTYVFTSTRGDAYTLDGFSTIWQLAKARANLPDLRFHDLRHAFATRIRRAGHGLDVIQALLGHSSLAMSQRYAHIGAEAVRAAVADLDVATR